MIKCPDCGYDTRVYESRRSEDGNTAIRRRECLKCRKRFKTAETITEHPKATEYIIAGGIRIKARYDSYGKTEVTRQFMEQVIIPALEKCLIKKPLETP